MDSALFSSVASTWQLWFWLFCLSGVACCFLGYQLLRGRRVIQHIQQEHFSALAVLTQSFPDPVFVTDINGLIIAASPAAEKFFHYSNEELLKMNVERLIPGEFAKAHRKQRRRFMRRDPGTAMEKEVSCLTKPGEKIPVETRVRTFRLDNRMYGLVSVHDISEFKNREAVLRTLSERDALTGLGNRRLFDTRFQIEWSRALRTTQPLAVLIIDIDTFKQYNDYYGHQQGDQCLIHVALLLRSALRRSTDSVYRYGGEEFVCLIPGLGLPEAAQVGEHLRQRVEQVRIAHHCSPCSDWVTISVGVASMVPQPSIDRRVLVEQADHALYQSKLNGRNRVTTFQESDEMSGHYKASSR